MGWWSKYRISVNRIIDSFMISWYVLYVSSVRKIYPSSGLRADQFFRHARIGNQGNLLGAIWIGLTDSLYKVVGRFHSQLCA